MNTRTSTFVVLILGILALSAVVEAGLITNTSFEIVPDGSTGQGILPTDWVNIPPPSPTADTYSNDGSYGLSPGAFGNFTGVTAFDGIRWVAGWSEVGQESFGQFLSSPVVEGVEYEISGWLHQALRSDLNHPGGYEVYLTDTPGVQTELLGFLGPTTSFEFGWEFFAFTFTATASMASLDFVEFAPIATTTAGGAYPGLDLVSFDTVEPGEAPAPATWALVVWGLAAVMATRRRP